MNRKHGHNPRGQESGTYISWRSMLDRCTNDRCKDYPRYGGAGVTVHARWLSFEGFLADMGERPPATTLDRLDGTRGYEPGNCRWATRKEQQRNVSTNVKLTYQGKTLCIAEWAELYGISRHKVGRRLRRGWPLERALSR